MYKRQHVYRDTENKEFYIIELLITKEDKIVKISEYISKDLKTLTLMGKPYTKEVLNKEFKTLEEVYEYMYKNNTFPLYNVKDESYGDKLY